MTAGGLFRSMMFLFGMMVTLIFSAPVWAAEGDNAPANAAQGMESGDGSYLLGSGDKVKVSVFGEEELSGEFDVAGTGKVSLPLIGQVQAAGLSPDDFRTAVENKLKDGYLTNPKVSVEVLNYRPFYILGEVAKAGEYPYKSGMTVMNAVALAGGYSYRANTDRVYISRDGAKEKEFDIDQSLRVLPGDVVRIPERFF